ncbi:MAG: polymerase, beta domain protein region protein [candidate division CPR3 bacterium GW2011_GWE2_35_7]|uniref:Polymerase, beta domain protein region protein n=1 Tax=candidate division CPR3 bacterium GW2011_GWF2_35_18 TaxID=1618350 RepID=A0A0G0E321_UNCC3|nr:MAG: polymerase, beta domain protein region protein [candidate division CPR3 bacterium GW2011_GWF2_35_18]KKP87072.1 MAG: polymerase, beta domain protein region protein [candidate division CPR3 bacterium GW2011_GWE2_35_7]OGB64077.1 MAG: hypothetical protein A2250_04730 [candidate division CPR3 bacterium RIFOXYA2_FULL_35_13]
MPTRSEVDLTENSDLDLLIKNKNIRMKLKSLVSKIVKEFDPERIYLFGSYARGRSRKHAAMDILVIGETKLRFIERIKSILKLNKSVLIINPLFYTEKEFEILKKNNDGFMITVLEEAVVLYQKQAENVDK